MLLGLAIILASASIFEELQIQKKLSIKPDSDRVGRRVTHPLYLVKKRETVSCSKPAAGQKRHAPWQ